MHSIVEAFKDADEDNYHESGESELGGNSPVGETRDPRIVQSFKCQTTVQN